MNCNRRTNQRDLSAAHEIDLICSEVEAGQLRRSHMKAVGDNQGLHALKSLYGDHRVAPDSLTGNIRSVVKLVILLPSDFHANSVRARLRCPSIMLKQDDDLNNDPRRNQSGVFFDAPER